MKIKINHEILNFNLNEVVRQARANKSFSHSVTGYILVVRQARANKSFSHSVTGYILVVRQARANKYGSNSKKKKLMRDLYFQIKPQVNDVLNGKYHINALWLVPSKNRDLDNLLLKAILDCMQENGMLVNDNLNNIVSINHSFEVVNKDAQGVVIEFVEVA